MLKIRLKNAGHSLQIGFAGLLLMLLLNVLPAAAQQGKDITKSCTITMPGTRENRDFAFDNKYRTAWEKSGRSTATITVKPPKGTRQGGLYICFAQEPAHMDVLSGDKQIYQRDGAEFAHRYIPFEGDQLVTVKLKGDKHGVAISELRVIAGDQPPDWVQRWQPPYEQADLLVLVAHPDDELLWLGGTIPYYALERQKRVAVAYMTCANPMRRSEMLNGLWTAGIRHYPYIGTFRDKRVCGMEASLRLWGGEKKPLAYVTALYRRLKPQVVVSQDLRGEYGHPAHIITSKTAVAALAAAADASQFADSAQKFGTWEVPKAYIHLLKDNAIRMDWQRPLAGLGGKTALQVCADAYAMHRSQRARYSVQADGPYCPSHFGLYRSQVGPDVQKNDFFEHIDESKN